MFQPITSLDDFMTRVQVVYPNWHPRTLEYIRERYNEGNYELLYDDKLVDTVSDWRMESHFGDEEVLAVIDQDGNIIPEKLAELIATAKKRAADQTLKPQRQQLTDDFRMTFLTDLYGGK